MHFGSSVQINLEGVFTQAIVRLKYDRKIPDEILLPADMTPVSKFASTKE